MPLTSRWSRRFHGGVRGLVRLGQAVCVGLLERPAVDGDEQALGGGLHEVVDVDPGIFGAAAGDTEDDRHVRAHQLIHGGLVLGGVIARQELPFPVRTEDPRGG